MSAYGYILLGAFGGAAPGDEASARQDARSRTQDHLLQELLDRFEDKSAFTR